jgi:hypothetical protein
MNDVKRLTAYDVSMSPQFEDVRPVLIEPLKPAATDKHHREFVNLLLQRRIPLFGGGQFGQEQSDSFRHRKRAWAVDAYRVQRIPSRAELILCTVQLGFQIINALVCRGQALLQSSFTGDPLIEVTSVNPQAGFTEGPIKRIKSIKMIDWVGFGPTPAPPYDTSVTIHKAELREPVGSGVVQSLEVRNV